MCRVIWGCLREARDTAQVYVSHVSHLHLLTIIMHHQVSTDLNVNSCVCRMLLVVIHLAQYHSWCTRARLCKILGLFNTSVADLFNYLMCYWRCRKAVGPDRYVAGTKWPGQVSSMYFDNSSARQCAALSTIHLVSCLLHLMRVVADP